MWVPESILEYQFRLHGWLRALWNLRWIDDMTSILNEEMEMVMTDMENMESKVAAMEDEEKAMKSAFASVKAKMDAMAKEIADMQSASVTNDTLKAWADRLQKVHDDMAADMATMVASGDAA